MHLGILETGRVPEHMEERHRPYPVMFRDLYRAVAPDVRITTVPVMDGILPDDPAACNAWLITGSKYGVYDDDPGSIH